MNRKILLLAICMIPLALFSQTYRYTKETRIEYDGRNAADTVYVLEQANVVIDVQITKNNITVKRPPNGSGEPVIINTYTIKKISKGNTNAKITTREGYVFMIYPDGILMHYKKDRMRIDYSFYNGINRKFLYE